jgi:hypothetical protein
MYAAVVGGLLIMVMSKINTFMSDGAVNQDAGSPELEHGAWPVVAGKQRGRSGDDIGAGTRHVAAASISLSARRACARTCGAGWGTVGAGATFKIPRDVLTQLRASSRRSGLPLSVIVTEAIKKCLTPTHRRGRHG